MTLEEQIRLKNFVDRDYEVKGFSNLLDKGDHHIMIVCGADGIGKTSLLTRLVDECGRRSRRLVKVRYPGFGEFDYLMVMRQVIDALGENYFRPLLDLINYFTVPDYKPKIILELNGSIEVAKSAKFVNSTVGDIIGIKNVQLPPRSDMRVPEEERVIRLSKQFFSDLNAAVAALTADMGNNPMIIFVDDMEKMTESTRAWLWASVLRSVLDSTLKNVKFVLGIHDAPACDQFMEAITQVARLQPLEEGHITEYLNKRLKEVDQSLIDMVVAVSKGLPMTVATMVDSYLLKYPDRRAS
jgi:Cdc6-like AAA superfamily ATPase